MQEQPNSDNTPNDILPEIARSARPAYLKTGLTVLGVLLLLVATFLAWKRRPGSSLAGSTQAVQTSSPSGQASLLAPYATPDLPPQGIIRLANPVTVFPNRPRVNVITYTVQSGDNLFSIGTNFNLKPETILWGNYDTLKDNPEVLQIDQVLNILPVNGVYYKWRKGDTVAGVAANFKTDPEEIVNFIGNKIDLTTALTSTLAIAPDTWVVIPGGKRPLKDWGPPAISRSNPAVARYYGPGSCGSIYEGAIGTGAFVWPTTAHFLSGYSFSGIHPAVDFAGALGNAVYAADSGVVVYAGWSNFGYGNLLVIDHGNGWQTAYAHLNSIGVSCGQSVARGTMVAALGTTGNSSGPHLHFEMAYNGVKVNPMDYLH